MIKYSTPNDLLRLFREEETEEESHAARMETDYTESLALLKETMDRLQVQPSEACIRKLLAYSRSLRRNSH
ncbi:MAG: hypothetical protein FWJ85_00845 [Solitalea sp.]